MKCSDVTWENQWSKKGVLTLTYGAKAVHSNCTRSLKSCKSMFIFNQCTLKFMQAKEIRRVAFCCFLEQEAKIYMIHHPQYPFLLSPAYAGGKCFRSVCVCLSVCLYTWVITFEYIDKETSFGYGGTSLPYLVWVSRSLDQGQGHTLENVIWLPGHQFNLVLLV